MMDHRKNEFRGFAVEVFGVMAYLALLFLAAVFFQ